MSDPEDVYTALEETIQTVIFGKGQLIEHLAIALLADGHVLLEGVPGVAKTTIAKLFTEAVGLEFSRVQMTPDMLPADITGSHVYHEGTNEFVLHEGPIMTNLLLADELNRATPKTQSALLEAMEERHVTIEGETIELPSPFLVIATLNPIEIEGTFHLPEAQRDRFMLKLTVDLPNREDEAALLDQRDADPHAGQDAVDQVLDREMLLAAREAVTEVFVEPRLKDYMLDLVEATRTHEDVAHGGSPRASLAFLATAKTRAAIRGRDYVIPDDIKAMAHPVLDHRLVLTTESELNQVSATDVVDDVLGTVESPGGELMEFDETTEEATVGGS